jgi:outer membrane receptor protein involved in Fe transport
MGGGVRILPASPNTSAVQGLLQADAGSTAHGSLNYNAAGMFNAPIVPHLVAVRGSLYHYEDSGYIDNNYPGDPALGVAPHSRRNAGRAETAGGRIAMLLTPTEAFSVKVSALMQNTDTNGLLEEQPSLGKWKQSRLFDESLKDHFQIYSLDVGYDFGPVKLASNTSYFSRKYGENRDISAFFGLPFSLENSQKDEVLTQELRLSSDYESSLTWIAGLYLQSERDRPEQTALWRGDEANSQAILGQSATTPSFLLHDVQTLHQYAAFGEATWQITPTFAAIVGGRWSSYDYDQRTVHDGVLNGGLTMESVSSREHVFTPKLELRYSPSRNRNFYALAAKGYRVGAPNVPVPTAVCGADLAAVGLTAAPAAVKSDSLWNYEVGAKTAWDHGRVTANAAAFQIEWSGIQSAISLPCGFNFGVNAGKVRSQGLELEIASRFGDGWVIGLNTAYVHAVLVEPLPSLVGITGIGGARVPGIPEWTVAANIQRDFHVMDRNAYARLDASYVSGFLNQYPQAAVLGSPPDSSGDYTLVNARLGVDLAPSVTGELYIDNMFDERAKQVVSTEIPDHRTTFARPRTAGVVLRWRF